MLVAYLSQYFFGIAIFISSVFLVLLVLVQRGRGGGLTGALGGPGGQSAFGTKAGDLFTKITVGVASVWILLCIGAVYFLREGDIPDLGTGSASSSETGSFNAGAEDSGAAADVDSLAPGLLDSDPSQVVDPANLGAPPSQDTDPTDEDATAGEAESTGDVSIDGDESDDTPDAEQPQ